MVVNEKKSSEPYPQLFVNNRCLKVEKSGKYLGDMINHKNNNDDLISDGLLLRCREFAQRRGRVKTILKTILKWREQKIF